MPTESYWAADRSEPVLETTVGTVLREAAKAAPDTIAIVAGVPGADRRRWTYGELLAEAEAAARALLGRFEPEEHLAYTPKRSRMCSSRTRPSPM